MEAAYEPLRFLMHPVAVHVASDSHGRRRLTQEHDLAHEWPELAQGQPDRGLARPIRTRKP
ncbi:MAG: hypothetical protein ABI647_13090 [Gemmatimonadota bacterium]